MRLIGSLMLHFRCVAPTHPTHPFLVQLLSEVMSVVMATESTAHSYSDPNFLVFPALHMPGNKSLKRMRRDCYPRVLITPRKHCARELEEACVEKKNNNNLPGNSKRLLISLAIRLLSISDKHGAKHVDSDALKSHKISNVSDKQLQTGIQEISFLSLPPLSLIFLFSCSRESDCNKACLCCFLLCSKTTVFQRVCRPGEMMRNNLMGFVQVSVVWYVN